MLKDGEQINDLSEESIETREITSIAEAKNDYKCRYNISGNLPMILNNNIEPNGFSISLCLLLSTFIFKLFSFLMVIMIAKKSAIKHEQKCLTFIYLI